MSSSKTSRSSGKLIQWDDAKGYGFIVPDEGGAKLFVHIKAFGLRAGRPFVGERLSFVVGSDAQGKRRALEVRSLEPRQAADTRKRRDEGSLLWLIPGFALLVLGCQLLWGLPHWLWGMYLAMSLASFIVYFGDKRAAVKGDQWRVPERTLHLLALACGWPGALLAQNMLKHKHSKREFLRWFWLSVVLNVSGFLLVFTPLGRLIYARLFG